MREQERREERKSCVANLTDLTSVGVRGICRGLQAGEAMQPSAQSIQEAGGGGNPGSLEGGYR